MWDRRAEEAPEHEVRSKVKELQCITKVDNAPSEAVKLTVLSLGTMPTSGHPYYCGTTICGLQHCI